MTGIGHLVQWRKSRFKELLYSFLQHKFKIFVKLSKMYLRCFYNRLNVTIPRTDLFSRFKLRKESHKCKSLNIHPYSITFDCTPASLDGTSYFGPTYLESPHYHVLKSVSQPQLLLHTRVQCSNKLLDSIFKMQPEFDHLSLPLRYSSI